MRSFLLATLLCLPSMGWAQPPDWSATLKLGDATVPVSGWFDEARTKGFFTVGDWTSRVYRAWKVEVVDVDGDGNDELLVGIWSDQPRHDEPNPHRTVWVLRWNAEKHRLDEAWRGSALARPLLDFHVDGAHLIALETARKGCRLTTYYWTGFGFAARSARPTTCETR